LRPRLIRIGNRQEASMKLVRLGLVAALAATLAIPAFAQTPSTGAGKAATPPARSATTPPGSAQGTAQGKLVDLNSAPASELDALPGIGPARAAAIVKNRPYKGKDEIVTKAGIPQNVYNNIKDRIVARQH
jgi:competence protein ComEA